MLCVYTADTEADLHIDISLRLGLQGIPTTQPQCFPMANKAAGGVIPQFY